MIRAVIFLVAMGASIVATAEDTPIAPTAATGDPIKREEVYLGPEHQYAKPVASWRELKSLNVVMQEHEYTCGAASLATLLKNCFDDKMNEPVVLAAALTKLSKAELEDRQKNGLSMEDLANGASRLNYAAAVLEVKYEKLQSLKVPVIVRLQHDDFKHFVVYRGQVGNRVFVADPLRGNVTLPVKRFWADWDGKILAVVARGRKPPQNTPLAVPPWQPVTPENEAARQAIVGAPLPPAWVAYPR